MVALQDNRNLPKARYSSEKSPGPVLWEAIRKARHADTRISSKETHFLPDTVTFAVDCTSTAHDNARPNHQV